MDHPKKTSPFCFDLDSLGFATLSKGVHKTNLPTQRAPCRNEGPEGGGPWDRWLLKHQESDLKCCKSMRKTPRKYPCDVWYVSCMFDKYIYMFIFVYIYSRYVQIYLYYFGIRTIYTSTGRHVSECVIHKHQVGYWSYVPEKSGSNIPVLEMMFLLTQVARSVKTCNKAW